MLSPKKCIKKFKELKKMSKIFKGDVFVNNNKDKKIGKGSPISIILIPKFTEITNNHFPKRLGVDLMKNKAHNLANLANQYPVFLLPLCPLILLITSHKWPSWFTKG